MIEALISSKTRIKLLLKFFLNTGTTGYLRGLESEFGESSNSIRLELNKFEKAGMLSSYAKGNRKYFKANDSHPLFKDIHKIVLKHTGIDKLIETIISRLGALDAVYLVGQFSKGIDSAIIDILLVGNIDEEYLVKVIQKAETLIDRKVRYLIYSQDEFEKSAKGNFDPSPLLLWTREKENE